MQKIQIHISVILFLLIALSCSSGQRDPVRYREKINSNWEFRKFSDASQEKGSADLMWEKVDLPHDWSIFGPFDQQNPSGRSGGYLPGGIGWYKKEIIVPASYKNHRMIIEFDGVYKDADIFINDRLLGHRTNGYLSFCYDLTPYLIKNGKNILKVRVDNTDLPHDRWYSGCGIYRHVWINYVPDVYIPVWGTYITTPEITNDNSKVRIGTEILNKGKKDQNCVLKTIIVSPAGVEVASNSSDFNVTADSSVNIVQNIDIPNPQLWSLESPLLYKAKSQIFTNNRLSDEYESSFGIRKIEFTPDRGFLLNGKKVIMKGVNIHHEAGGFGSAVPDMAIHRRLAILKEMGCNSIRLSHNPHSPVLLSMCDTMGILLIDEAFDKWGLDGSVKQRSAPPDFRKNWKSDLKDLIVRDRNHPSVVLWSVGNEVKEIEDPSGVEMLKTLVDFVHDFEPSRPVTCALFPGRQANGEPYEMAFYMDVVSYNYMSQYYEQDHKKYPEMILLGSETLPYYTRNNLGSRLWEKDISTKYIPGNSFFKVGDFVAGHFIWSGIDYLGEASQPWPLRGWETGLINTCGFQKPFSYYIRSLYSDEPMVYIAVRDELENHRAGKTGWDWPPVKNKWNWPFDENKKLTVYTYTTCESVELLLNGKSLGLKSLKDFPDKMIEWKVPYQKGELLAVGKIAGKETVRYKVTTAGTPEKIMLLPDRTEISANGEDVVHVTAMVVDEDGTVCQDNNVPVEFLISEKGKIVAVDNGDLWSDEPYKSNRREIRDGKALCVVQSGMVTGEIVLRANSPGLTGDSIRIKINPISGQ